MFLKKTPVSKKRQEHAFRSKHPLEPCTTESESPGPESGSSAEAIGTLPETTIEDYIHSDSDDSTSTVKPATIAATSARSSLEECSSENYDHQLDNEFSSRTVQASSEQPDTMSEGQSSKSKKKPKKSNCKRLTKHERKKKSRQTRQETEQGSSSQPPSSAPQRGTEDRERARGQDSSSESLQHTQAPSVSSPATSAGKASSSSAKDDKGKQPASNTIIPILSAVSEFQSSSYEYRSSTGSQSLRYEHLGHVQTPNPSRCDSLSPVPETPLQDLSAPTAAASSHSVSGESSSTTHGLQSHTTAATSQTGSHGPNQQPTPKPPGFWWDLMFVNFTCAKADCEKACNLWFGSVICPRCGPYSEIRYCTEQHLREDVKAHWMVCGQFTFEHFCVSSSIPPEVLKGPPLIPCRHNWDSPERHRQALWFSTAQREGDYFIFADWSEQTHAGALPGDVDMRCSPHVALTVRFEDAAEKDRFRRILAICLFSKYLTFSCHYRST